MIDRTQWDPTTGEGAASEAIRGVRRVAIAGKFNCPALAELFHVSDASRVELPGGGESPKISALVRPLLNLGLELHLVTLSNRVTEAFQLHGPNITLTVCPSRSSKRARDFFSMERHEIRTALSSRPVEVVHAHHTYEYALGALATGLPTLITVRDWATTIIRLERGGLASPARSLYLAAKVGMQLATLKRGEHFTVNSPYLERRVTRAARRPVNVIPNCLPAGALTWTRRELNRQRPSIVAINRGFNRYKNVRSLLMGFAIVRERFPDARLLLAGPGYETEGPAWSWAKRRGVEHGVQFLGPLAPDEVIQLLDSADVLAHPSREESFGMVLMEAMARGTPVVGGARSGAVPWVLADGEAGVLTDVDDPRALANAISGLLSDPRRWNRLSAAGREHVRDRFSAQAVASRYVKEYERVLAVEDAKS